MAKDSKLDGTQGLIITTWVRMVIMVPVLFFSTYFLDALAQTIAWGNAVGDHIVKENNDIIDATFVVQMGRFDGDFDPATNNISLWQNAWRPFDEANTANAGLNIDPEIAPGSSFISRSNAMNLNGTTTVSPFAADGFDFRSPSGGPDKQAYLWVRNDPLGGGNPSEWALLTDSTWVFPVTVDGSLSENWRTGETTTAVYGTFTEGAFNTITSQAVPEPSSALLVLCGLAPFIFARKRNTRA